MDFMKYDLALDHINDLKALRNRCKITMLKTSLRENLVSWWKSLNHRPRKVSAAYRAELLRQEWVVGGETLKQTEC
ncbi:MAG: hypothetical protein J0I20_28965 [Chloroflexi bacterium]|nr:hypothetical protein [Chloroflexota bacterium]OJV96340.1 MAG: hypothetical protein BGO39_01100 [Chloroflexi bacterium 54-19]